MNYNEYLSHIQAKFAVADDVVIGQQNAKMLYEEKLELKWLATKLKVFSFVTHASHIAAQDISLFSDACTAHALNAYKGLPRGFQNGVASFNVMASEKVDATAAAFAVSRPKKRFAAFPMPVIYNLSTMEIFYYRDTPMWGAIYYKYLREYIENNFNMK
ncbi:MAG: hypothetical protein FWC76_06275 [Defluviitaleaceae bacterium]|nr:hypothetical protein [Defluviitaleaceae bacterium]